MAGNALCFKTNTVTASPTDATETVIATLTGVTPRYGGQTVKLTGWASISVQAAVVSIALKVRRDSVSGTQVGATITSPTFAAAGSQKFQATINVLDSPTGEFAGATYVLTATLASAGGASTVDGASLEARID